MEGFTDHREIAYKLWVESGRDVKQVAALLRLGDPDKEWESLPSATPALIRGWSLQQGWALRQFDDFRTMVPDQFAQTRATYHRLAPHAAILIGDVMHGVLDSVDPRVVRNRLDAAKHITAVTGQLPYNRMDSSQEVVAPKQDYGREIADLTVDELRERRRVRALSVSSDSHGVTIASMLPERVTAPERSTQSIIEAQFDHHREPSESPLRGSKRT